MKTKKSIIFGALLLIVTYFTVRLFIDLPPKININIDYIRTKRLKNFSKEKLEKMAIASKNSTYFEKICFYKYLHVRDEKIYRYCADNNLGKDIGGGCYHFIGRYNQNDMFNMLNYCK